jgi:thymidylate synthase (FAD)
MRLVKPSYEILHVDDSALKLLELAGRTCYKSEDRIADGTAEPFVKRIVQDYKHESVIEHACITVKFIVDRGVTHELVRHRLCSFSQESTRYCNYGKAGQVTFVIPPWLELQPGDYVVETVGDRPVDLWTRHLIDSERRYLDLLKVGWTPQQARSVLPNSLKTEIVTTANFREWRHILKLRTAKVAHPQMREIMEPLLVELKTIVPVIFDDIIEEAAE